MRSSGEVSRRGATGVANAAMMVTDTYSAADFTNGVLDLGYSLDYSADWTITAEIKIGSVNYNEWGTPAFTTGSDAFSGSGLQVYLVAGDEKALRTVWFGNSHDSKVMTGTRAGDVLTVTYNYDADATESLLTVGYALVRDGYTYTDNVNNDGWYKATVSAVNPSEISALSTTINGLEGWSINSISVTHSVVPEPATASLSLLGLAALMMRRRRA